MKYRWPSTQLGEVLKERNEEPLPDDLYSGRVRIVEKISFNSGQIHLRVGGATKTGMILIHPGDLVVSGINAAKGAIAIYDDAAASPVAATIHYGAYIPNPERVSIRFLWWMLRSRFFQELLREYVPGGIKTELKAKRLLPVPIPLPSLAEQQRVVVRIEELAALINEVRTLRHQSAVESEMLCRSILTHDNQAIPTPMRELVSLRPLDVTVRADETYQFAGVYCFGRGVFKAGSKSGMDFAYTRLTQLKVGNFVYPKLMAWEGALGVVPKECDGCVVSPEFPVFEVLEDRILPEVLDTYFKDPTVWPAISGASSGTNIRRRRLNPQSFLNYSIPLPARRTQEQLRKVRAQVDVLKRLRAETDVEIEALLPAILDRAFKGDL